jgi:biotin transport system substrate-specific component
MHRLPQRDARCGVRTVTPCPVTPCSRGALIVNSLGRLTVDRAEPRGAAAERGVSPVPVRRPAAAGLALAGMMAALLVVCSWLSIPFYPVPLTLQTLAVLVAGGLLGRVWGPVSIAVYLLLGLVGLPVFSGFQAGPGVLFGPLGGYLFGFVAAALVMGLAGDLVRDRSLQGRTALLVLGVAAAAASAIIYLAGVPWLSIVTGMSLGEASAVGLFPFILGDAVKAVVAVLLIRAVDVALEAQGLR